MDILTTFALSFLGVPYIYGGNNRTGIDCSGLICELCRAWGIIGKQDYSAHDLYLLLKTKNLRNQITEGSILFFTRNPQRMAHVAYALDNHLMIEAGGGDETTRTLEDAKKRNACVRIRPIKSRRDLYAWFKLEVDL